MTKTVAVLMDGGYVINNFRDRHQLSHIPQSQDIIQLSTKACLIDDEELFRVFYYDCYPYEGEANNASYSGKASFKSVPESSYRKKLYNELAATDLVAFRSGVLKFRGWKLKDNSRKRYFKHNKFDQFTDKDFSPVFQQKGVDIKIGLDIAWLSNSRIVDRIILVTADTDFIPAMKYARRAGVQVVWATFDSPKGEMTHHSDFARHVSWK